MRAEVGGDRSKVKYPKVDTMKKSAAQNYSDEFAPGTQEWDAICRMVERNYPHLFK